MAIAAEGRNNSGIFWINDTSEDDDQAVVYVPGVSRKPDPRQGSVGLVHDKGNKRRPSQQSSHSNQSAAGMSTAKKTPSARAPPAKTKTSVTTSKPPDNEQDAVQTGHLKTKPSFKDLCPEDKRRIANLIQELARVSEEKEESVQKLRDEQETFEKKILQLEQQNQLISQERESLQQQYRECQELLCLYQQYLTQQQDKLNQSIAQLHQAHSTTKSSRSERSSRRSRSAKSSAAPLNGSYLDLPSPRDPPVNRTTSTATATASVTNYGPASSTTPTPTPTPTTVPPSTAGSSVSDPKRSRSAPRPRREHQRSALQADLGPVAATAESQGLGGVSGAKEGGEQWGRGGGGDAGGTVGMCLARPADWEERRRRLVEQKRQLEQERERLQHRLAMQEERLQQIDTAGQEKTHSNGSLLNQPPQVNGYQGHSNDRGDAAHLTGADAVPGCDVPSCHDPNLGPPKRTPSQESPPLTKKDMATSPAVPLSTPLSPPPPPPFPSS
ncbi:protein hinderin, partial [Engraulis encrasicolus]|uniref:protein hinderin n=1 Tax=Engraulis encrasicolus TaxID=184585 RepID=UPI002FCED075